MLSCKVMLLVAKCSFKLFFSFIIMLLLFTTGCDETVSDPNGDGNNKPGTPASLKFLVGYNGGGSHGEEDGMCLVTNSGNSVQFLSTYYPYYSSNDYVDYKNGRFAYTYRNSPPEGYTPIAYFDVDKPTDVQIIPIPPAVDEDHYWSVPTVRPQVFSDGRIAFMAVNETENPWDDAHDGQICIYNPKTKEYLFSGSVVSFVLNQPEQGSDTEAGSLGGKFALSQNEQFIVARAYGFGTDMGSYHVDYKFVVKWPVNGGAFERIAEGDSQIYFVSADNNNVILHYGGGKQSLDVNSGNATMIDAYNDFIAYGMYSKKDGKFFKQWRGGGIALYDKYSGWLFNPVEADSLKYPYQGLGVGSQFSSDESKIYFKATKDYYTNDETEFCVYSTPLTLGYPNSAPDSLFILPAEYDTKLFILLD